MNNYSENSMMRILNSVNVEYKRISNTRKGLLYWVVRTLNEMGKSITYSTHSISSPEYDDTCERSSFNIVLHYNGSCVSRQLQIKYSDVSN